MLDWLQAKSRHGAHPLILQENHYVRFSNDQFSLITYGHLKFHHTKIQSPLITTILVSYFLRNLRLKWSVIEYFPNLNLPLISHLWGLLSSRSCFASMSLPTKKNTVIHCWLQRNDEFSCLVQRRPRKSN